MEGVWLWAHHIQAIHSESFILRSMKLLGQSKFFFFRRMKNQCLQDERVDCSSHRMRAFEWEFEGSQRVPKCSHTNG